MALIGNWTGKNLELGRRRMGAKLAKLGRMEMKLKRLIYRVSTKKLPSLFFGNNSLKSSPNFKTVLDLQFWPSRSLDIGVRTHQGSFSVFTFFKKLYRLSRFDHSSGLSKPQINISYYFLKYFPHKSPNF